MQDLKLHSFGQNDHIDSLKKKYDSLKERIKGNRKMVESEKDIELKNLNRTFENEKKYSKNNLY